MTYVRKTTGPRPAPWLSKQTPEKRREIARLGGLANTREQRQEKGRLGGLSVSRDREHMSRIGSIGGKNSVVKRRENRMKRDE